MTIRMQLAVCVAMALGALAAVPAKADPSTFRISQIYSNLDGSLQFVELTEMAGLNGQHHLAGLTFTITRDGAVKHYVLPNDLPSEYTANVSIIVAASNRLPVGGAGFYACCYPPTIASLPERFLPTGAATLDFAGVDQVSYAALPTDGTKALYRDGTVRAATVAGGRFMIDPTYSYIHAIEYYNPALDHFFITALGDEIDDLDAGRQPGWERTGETFAIGGGFYDPVCRFYLPPSVGDSHFYSASADECAQVQARFPEFMLETTAAFHVTLPDPESGACPADMDIYNGGGLLDPLYRLWNGRLDSNHRYTKSKAIRDAMVRAGYVSEGYGPMGVAMCVR